MADAVIVSTARTGIGKAFRGSTNLSHGTALAGHAIEHAVERSKVDPKEIEDCILGCGLPEGATGHNVARNAAVRAGLPVTVAGTTVNRFCSSGLQAISMAAQRVIVDKVPVHGRRRRRVDQPRAGQPEPEPLHRHAHRRPGRPDEDRVRRHLADEEQAAAVHADDRHRRRRRQALQGQPRVAGRVRVPQPAAHRQGSSRGQVRRRDRAVQDHDAARRQGDRRALVQRSHAGQGRVQPPRHAARGSAGRCSRSTTPPRSRPATPASSRTARRRS